MIQSYFFVLLFHVTNLTKLVGLEIGASLLHNETKNKNELQKPSKNL